MAKTTNDMKAITNYLKVLFGANPEQSVKEKPEAKPNIIKDLNAVRTLKIEIPNGFEVASFDTQSGEIKFREKPKKNPLPVRGSCMNL